MKTSTKEIPVYYDQEVVGTTKVSLIDYYWAKNYKWRFTPQGHVYRNSNLKGLNGNTKCRRVYLHREIMGASFGDGWVVDHRNNDPSDNRRENLRVTTQAQNMRYVATQPVNPMRQALAAVVA